MVRSIPFVLVGLVSLLSWFTIQGLISLPILSLGCGGVISFMLANILLFMLPSLLLGLLIGHVIYVIKRRAKGGDI